jgi:YidC/Oxa1 family membrane protein insertase
MALWTSLVSFLEMVLLTFYSWTGNGGVAVIIFTIIARLILLPLTVRQLQSSRKIQALQPALQELQRKHGKDQQKLQAETMRLYKENNANPVTGCLPMFVQLPLFLGIYQAVFHLTSVTPAEHAAAKMLAVLQTTANLGTSIATSALDQPPLSGGFLWLIDLGKTDPYYILPVLSVIFQLIVQLMSTPRVQDPQQKAMTQTLLFMPLLFGYIGFTFPSGAVLYWVVGSILSMIQQYVIGGWGSLANYLKFLPTDAGFFPAPVVVGVSQHEVEASHAHAKEPVEFWDVLKPLNDPDHQPPTK